MQDTPDLQTFKRNNPGKSINDYYREYPEMKSAKQIPPIDKTPDQQQVIYIREESQSTSNINSLNIMASIAIIVGSFLPWIDFNQLVGWPVEGNLFVIPPAIDTYMDIPNKAMYKLLYLIPIGAFITFLAEITKKSGIRFWSQNMTTLPMLFFGVLTYQLIYVVKQTSFGMVNISGILGLGFYVTLAGCLYFFIDSMSR